MIFHKMYDHSSVPKKKAMKILWLLLGLALAVITMHIVLKYISVVMYEEKHGFLFELSNRFDLNDENSVPQWITQALFLAMALGAGLAAYLAKKVSERRLWALIAVGGLLLSLDDVATLHEFILQSLHNTFFLDMPSTFFRNAWFVLLPFVLVAFVWLSVAVVRNLPRRTTIILIAGGMVYLCGAILIDSLANTVAERSFAGQGIYGGIEGGLQLIGSSLFLYGIVDYVEQRHGASIARALKRLRSAD